MMSIHHDKDKSVRFNHRYAARGQVEDLDLLNFIMRGVSPSMATGDAYRNQSQLEM